MLQALELTGFKSFADRTRLEFPAGVTAVVGPNGSGKSNVVDGIKWVLGSQSAKALRGSEMTDVIFNGSTSRRPVNTAEVSLEFDNTGGLFPVGGPIAEGEATVRITRRVYRSGEGEYLINGAAVRLRDLRSLMAGTGLGSQGGGSYGIIEQGRVDGVLQSTPNDRRALFEEAAGISRFRLKKQEASRRLARVEQNLLRLSDIVDEVEGRLRRVRAQAGKAQRYREQAERLKELRTELGLADWRALTASLDESELATQKNTTRLEATQAELDECEAALEAHQQQSEAGVDELAAEERRLAGVREAIASRQARLADETRRLAAAEEEARQARSKLLAAGARPAPEPQAEETQDLAAVEERLAAAKQAASQSSSQADAATQEREAAREAKRILSEKQRSTHRDTVKSQERVAALRTACDEATTAAESHNQSIASLAQSKEEAAGELRELSEQVDAQAAEVEAAAARLATVRESLSASREQLTVKQKELARAEAELVGLNHRHAAIEELEQKLEKLAADIRGVLTDDGSGQTPTVHGMVADLLHVDYDTAPMIEAALGPRAHHLVVDSADRLVNALAGGEAELRVRASFQRLDASTPATSLDRIDLSGEPGVMGRATAFVDSDDLYQPLVQRLLGRTWFVDSLATAARLSTGPGRGLSFVTYAGELLSADGGIYVGPKENETGLITNRRHASELNDEHHRTEAQVATLNAEVEALEAAAAEAARDEQSRFAEQTTAAEQLATGRQKLAAFQERTAALERESRQGSEAKSAADAKLSGLLAELAAAESDASNAVAVEQRLEAELSAANERAAAAEAALAEANNRASDARVVLAKAEHDFDVARAAAEKQQSRSDDSQHEQLRAELQQRQRQAGEQARASELALLRIRSELAELYLERDALAKTTRAATKQRRHEQQLRRRGAKRLQQLRDAVTQLTKQAQQSELEANQHRHQRQTLEERMREDYEIDLASVAADANDSPTIEPSERPDLERELQKLREQVHSIGPVNTEALEELDGLEERFEKLSAQYKDLSSAKASLERLTTRINTDSRELFLATMETVREHFRELFRRLFGGGEADLVLLQDEGEDVLESGVEIVAQPPGKELSSISLLSGGEKTMTCVALLLALFRTKPSPFCVLDEVDAALDEANIGRFTTVISEFLSSTQFLVITHSKKTMMGADTIYGVTMQESGVSTRVGVKFDDVGEDGQLKVASASKKDTTNQDGDAGQTRRAA